MAKKSITEIVATIVSELTPLESAERRRVVQASLTLLGEASFPNTKGSEQEGDSEGEGSLSARARTWMKQNNLSFEQILHVYHLSTDGIEVITADVPGRSRRDKVRNAYILLGIARLLSSGDGRFDDAPARELCERSGFYDQTNHARYLKGGNEFTGSKDKGWALTAPGLKHGAAIIKELISGRQ